MSLPITVERREADAKAAWLRLFPDDEIERAAMFPPGGFAMGTSLIGGPLTLDAFGTKRAPTPWELVESYKSLIFACVQINANAVVRSPLRLYANTSKGRRASDASGPRSVSRSMHSHLRTLPYCRSLGPKQDDVEEITNHPLIDTLDAPAVVEDGNGEVSYFSREDFLAMICVYCDVVGTHYVCPMGSRGRPPQYLWPLFSQYVIPQPMPGCPAVARYTYFAETFAPSELIRFRAGSLSLRDPYKGSYSPTYAALQYARLEDTFVAIQEQMLSAGPRPNLIVSAKDPMMPPSEVERRRFETDLNRRHAKGNAGNALVTTGSWDATPVSWSPQDLGGLEISKYDLQRTANCFGIPVPYLEGDTDAMNLKGADVQHARNSIEPRHRMIASALTSLARQYDPRLFFAFDPALPEDDELKARVIDMKLKNGSMTINQANEDTPLPPVEWGDEPWMSSGLIQPTMALAKQQMEQTSQAHDIENKDKATQFQFGEDDQQEPGSEPDDGELDTEDQAETDDEQPDDDSEARSIDDDIAFLRRAIREELRFGKGNPYHDDEGHFTGTGGHTGRKPKEAAKGRKKGQEESKPDTAKASAKDARKGGKATGKTSSETPGTPGKNSAKSEKSSGQTKSGGGTVVDSAGESSSKAKPKTEMTDREKKGKPEVLSVKAERAQKSQNKTTGEVQEYTKANEAVLAKRVGGKSFPDNDPADVHTEIGGGRIRPTELKTITHGKNDKITMSKSAIKRKVELEKELGEQMDVVVLDHRDRFAGGKNKALHSGHEIYYRRGVGSFRIGGMYKCKNDRELKKLMRTPYDDLPKEAQGQIRGTKS